MSYYNFARIPLSPRFSEDIKVSNAILASKLLIPLGESEMSRRVKKKKAGKLRGGGELHTLHYTTTKHSAHSELG